MRKTILFTALCSLALCSCNKEELAKQQQTIDSLNNVVALRDSSITLVATTLASVQANINYIKEKEGIISSSVGKGESSKEQLKEDVNAIYLKLIENKNKVAELQKKLNNAYAQNSEYKKIIEVLQQQIDQQNAEIEKLNALLADKDIEISYLNDAVIRLSSSVDSIATTQANTQAALESTTTELHTGYYIVAEKKTLKEKGLLETGLFSKKVLNGNVNNSYFTSVDVTEVEEIPLSGRRFNVLTNHPESSYTIDTENNVLKITDKDAFWNTSKYLIVCARGVEDED